jgi:hypothetical protein
VRFKFDNLGCGGMVEQAEKKSSCTPKPAHATILRYGTLQMKG